MKLHLPRRLMGVVIAALGGVGAVAGEVDLSTEQDLEGYTGKGTTAYEFQIKNDLNFTPESYPNWNASTPLMTDGVLTFTSATTEDEDKASLSFSGGDSYAFLMSTQNTKLSFDSLESLELSNNSAGAICLQRNSTLSITNIYNNDTTTPYVLFLKNTAEAGTGGAIRAYSNNSGVDIVQNGSVVFQENAAISSTESANGGALYFYYSTSGKNSININGNQNVSFSRNTALSTSSNNTHFAQGGAIYVRYDTNICNNTAVLFENNSAKQTHKGSSNAAYGGAIFITNKTLNISNNDKVTFFNNCTEAEGNAFGAAIYVSTSANLFITGNQEVVFEKNYQRQINSYELKSIHAIGGAGNLTLAAKTEGSITFYDSVYWGGGAISLNANYTDAEGKTQAAGGDIIFSGAKTAEHLAELKGSEASTDEIDNSRTSTFASLITLNGGTLQVVDGAILQATAGLELAANSDATLLLRDAKITGSGSTITLNSGTTLKLQGINTLESNLTLKDGASLSIGVSAAQMSDKNAALKFESASLTLPDSFSLYLAPTEALRSGRYNLISLSSQPSFWTADKVTVYGSGQTQGISFNDLIWDKDGILYYEIGQTVWADTDGVWSADETDGLKETFFGDSTAGTIRLDGDITPGYVVVKNSEGKDYSFASAENGGKLTGGTALLKQGDGTLTLETANTYAGGTILEEGTLIVHNDTALGDTANGAAVSTNQGTLLQIGDECHVTLAGENSIQGDVAVDAGSTLEMQNSGYAAERSEVDGTLLFTGEQVGAAHGGELSGSGAVVAKNSRVAFTSAKQYTGDLQILGEQASITLEDMLCVKRNLTLQGGGSIQATSVNVEAGAALTAAVETANDDLISFSLANDGAIAATNRFNEALAGVITSDALTLEPGSTYRAMGAHMGLNGGKLILRIGPENEDKINLVLETGAGYLADSQVILFSGVNELRLEWLGTEATQIYPTPEAPAIYEFTAADYFAGQWINDNTRMFYDTQAQLVYLQYVTNVVPEPTTSTLSVLTLSALALRRRRRR